MNISGNKVSASAFSKTSYILMKVIHIFFIITVITIPFGYGQSQILQVLNTSGGSSQNKGYSMEWNIGESALVNQMVSSDGSDILTNGFIQPLLQDIILPFTGIEFSSSSVRIYPN